MDWMNNLFLVLILTTVTGSVFYLIGLIFGRIWSGDDSKVLRMQMRITQWAFLLPFVYFVLYIWKWKWMSTTGSAVNLFYNTPMMQRVFAILGFVWITLFVVLIVRKLYHRHQWMRVFDGNIPEEDAEVEAMFAEICAQLGITGQVSLYRNDMVKMAYMLYWHGYAVVLPLKRYTREEIAVLLYHELCHYLNRDLYVKTVSCIVSLLHVINPLMPSMLKQLNLACEEYCDRCACQEGVELFSEKEYFQTILHVLNEEEKKERYDLLMLADTRSDFEKRVLCMKRFHERGGIKKGTALVLSVCFLIGSSMAALLAGAGMAEAYSIAAQATDIRAVDSEESLVSAEEVDNLLKENINGVRISTEREEMGIYKSFNYEIFERRNSIVVAFDGNSPVSNLVQEAKNGKGKAKIYVNSDVEALKDKATSLEGYVKAFKVNDNLAEKILSDYPELGDDNKLA